ncbi:unnamed protein product [Effrenium voratum]|uniref:Uncharacterized protein n=1 Tax=Effrenium voratum TaxID=2562239 RepID=A0AA36HN19_9DINO|nr:unnamed protein product [Effrenium voratum]
MLAPWAPPGADRSADESGPALRVRQAAAHARAAVGEEEVREFVNAEAQLRALAVHPDYHTDEDRLFQLLSIASTAVVDLERSPPEESRALDEAQRLLSKILGFCTAWLRLAGTGRLVEGLDGLRGCIASELVFQTVAAVVTSESGLGASMLLAFQELEGLSLMGKAACNVEEAALVLALRKLRVVAARCGAGRQGSSAESMMRSIESFRGNLLERVQLFAGRRERRLGVPQFKEIVGDIAGLLGEAYPSNQVFEMMCLLSMQLSVALITYCPDVPDADSLEAVEWLASVLRTLLDKGGAGPHLGLLSSPGALREWLEDSGFWKRLVTQASCRAQQHAHQLMTVLLSGGVLSSSDLVVALAKEGVLSRALPPSCRAALHGALLTTASNSEMEVALDMFSEVCSLLGFADISSEGIHLLTRLNLRALDAGYLLNSASASIDGSLAVPFLLQYLQWGYRQDSADLLGQLDFASRCLTRVLLPHPNLAILLPAVAAQALSSASETGGLSRQAAARCNRALCAVALDAAALAPSMDYSQLQMASPAVLLQAMPRVGSAPPFDFENTEYWLTSLVDCLSAFLSAGADIGSREVGLLWSRLVVRPILGLPASFTAGQYFKLAFLAQPAAAATLLAPFLAAPNPPPQVRLAYLSVFCPGLMQETPAMTSVNLFPEVRTVLEVQDPADAGVTLSSPPRLPQPLRHSLSSDGEEPWLGTGASLAAAAAAAGMAMADPSTSVPRMRLDRVQAVIQNSQSTGLFGELTVYDATERRLWDEFDELGRIDDVEALRQRDAAALRCLAALDKEIDAVGRAGRELPSALAEARAKFSSLCELVAGGAAAKSLTRIGKVEADYTKAEEDLIAASSAHQRSLARCRRLGQQAPSAEAVSTARAGLERAHLELVNEIRLAAQSAQLGLVEITGTPGLARAIRAAGPAHADPLLERLLHHSRWCERQAQHDPPAARSPLPQEPKVSSTPSRASEDAEALLERAEMRPKPGEVSPLGARSLRRGKAVVKSYGKDEKELCLQELRALLKLKTQQHVIQLLDVFKSEGLIYLEFPFCAGGSMHQWCQKVGPPLLRGDPDAFVRCLAIWRQIWQALSYIHLELVCHGDLTLDNMLLTADHHPVLTDFRCSTVAGHGPRRSLTPDYAAPELEADAAAVPSEASDVYSTGAAMAKAFLGLDLDVASCPYHPTRGQRSLPDERTDVDLADLLQHVLAENPIARPSAASVCSHRALDPSGFLRRRGLLTGQKRSPSQAFLDAAEALREEYRGRRMEDPLMFSREAVFDAIASSKVGEWREDALLGEWRVMLNEESGVDGGGLRREVVSLFFEQLESSSLVMRTGMEGSGVTTLFLNERQRADRSPQQWRQSWTAVGAMLLRALVHFGNAPLAFSSAVFDCALGRICRMPPDDAPAGEEEDVQGSIERLLKLREEKGDDWARSELLDLLRRLRREKEAGYRWMLAQRTQEERNGLSVNGLESRETIAAMLEPQSSLFLQRLGPELQGAALEWVLLWDLYLKFLGGGDRWLAYDALAEGFSAHGRRLEMWQALTGVQVVETLEGVELTAAVVLPNLEFKPGYGYETQIQYFRNVIETFSAEELSMFLRFSTGIGRLPASQRFPAGQKLSIRFMPDHLEHLPSAHTCFWVVDVPPYEDQEDLAQKLRLAIAAPQPFALS